MQGSNPQPAIHTGCHPKVIEIPSLWVLLQAGVNIYPCFCQVLLWGMLTAGHLQNLLVWVLPIGAHRDGAAGTSEWKRLQLQLSSAGVSVYQCWALGREVCSHFFQSSCRAGCCTKTFTKLKEGSQFQLLGLTMEPLSAMETGDRKNMVTSHFWGIFDHGKAPLTDGYSSTSIVCFRTINAACSPHLGLCSPYLFLFSSTWGWVK